MARKYGLWAMVFAVSCGKAGGTLTDGGGTTTGAGGGGEGGQGGQGGGSPYLEDAGLPDGGQFIACPQVQPFDDSACLPEERRCEYGTDPRGSRCRPLAICAQGNWSVIDPGCIALPAVTCPATREEAQGKACAPFDAYCSYDGLACHCTDCSDGPNPTCAGMGQETWHCQTPHADGECPAAMPNLGVACLPEGKKCGYGCSVGRRCENRVWVNDATTGGC